MRKWKIANFSKNLGSFCMTAKKERKKSETCFCFNLGPTQPIAVVLQSYIKNKLQLYYIIILRAVRRINVDMQNIETDLSLFIDVLLKKTSTNEKQKLDPHIHTHIYSVHHKWHSNPTNIAKKWEKKVESLSGI